MDMILPGTELTVEVAFDYSPPREGRNILANGDPGYPSEPAEVEICTVIVVDEHGHSADILYVLSKTCIEKMEEHILKNPPEPDYD